MGFVAHDIVSVRQKSFMLDACSSFVLALLLMLICQFPLASCSGLAPAICVDRAEAGLAHREAQCFAKGPHVAQR